MFPGSEILSQGRDTLAAPAKMINVIKLPRASAPGFDELSEENSFRTIPN